MGLFDFFKKKRGLDEGTFNSRQFRMEILAFALWKYNENDQDYEKVKQKLISMPSNLSETQVETVLQELKSFNEPVNNVNVVAGQVWKYNTRPGEEESRAIVFRVDGVNGEEIIHISLNNLRVRNLKGEDLHTLGHAPVSKKSFLRSATELMEQNEDNITVEEGYYDWRAAFDKGEAGVFEIEIKEIVSYIEQTING